LESSFDTLIDSTVHDDDNENEDDLPNNSELVSSFDLNQEDFSLSRNTDNALMKTSMNTLSDNCHNANLSLNEICPNTPTTTNSPIVTIIDDAISPNDKNLNTACINQNIKENLNACSLLDSPPESIYSKGRRYF